MKIHEAMERARRCSAGELIGADPHKVIEALLLEINCMKAEQELKENVILPDCPRSFRVEYDNNYTEEGGYTDWYNVTNCRSPLGPEEGEQCFKVDCQEAADLLCKALYNKYKERLKCHN